MSYDKLCDELMLMTNQIVAAIVEHRDGHRLTQKIRKEIVNIDEEKLSFALMRGAQLVETAKEYRKEVGNLHVIIHQFDKLFSFIFPLRDNYTLIVAVEPTMTESKTFITDVREIIRNNNMDASYPSS